MPNQTRRRLSTVEEVSVLTRGVNEANEFLNGHPIPKLLDRKRWTKKRWKRHEAAWSELDQERRHEQRKRAVAERKWNSRNKRIRHHKVLRELRKSERREFLDQREGKKIRRSLSDHHDSEQIIRALKGGATTVGQVCKKTGLETRSARRCLKKLVKSGDVEKPSPRQYQITKPKQRKRIDDASTKRRKRLNSKSKAR